MSISPAKRTRGDVAHLQRVAFRRVTTVDGIAFAETSVWGYDGKVFPGDSKHSAENKAFSNE